MKDNDTSNDITAQSCSSHSSSTSSSTQSSSTQSSNTSSSSQSSSNTENSSKGSSSCNPCNHSCCTRSSKSCCRPSGKCCCSPCCKAIRCAITPPCDPCLTVHYLSSIACYLYQCLDAEEIAYLSIALTTIGDNLATMLAQQDLCCDQGEEPEEGINESTFISTLSSDSSATTKHTSSNHNVKNSQANLSTHTNASGNDTMSKNNNNNNSNNE